MFDFQRCRRSQYCYTSVKHIQLRVSLWYQSHKLLQNFRMRSHGPSRLGYVVRKPGYWISVTDQLRFCKHLATLTPMLLVIKSTQAQGPHFRISLCKFLSVSIRKLFNPSWSVQLWTKSHSGVVTSLIVNAEATVPGLSPSTPIGPDQHNYFNSLEKFVQRESDESLGQQKRTV